MNMIRSKLCIDQVRCTYMINFLFFIYYYNYIMSSKLDYLKKYGGVGNSKDEAKKRLMKALTKDNQSRKRIFDDDE